MFPVVLTREGHLGPFPSAVPAPAASSASVQLSPYSGTPQQFLRSLGPGAYTTTVCSISSPTTPSTPEFWVRHIRRLAQSALLVASSDSTAFPSLADKDDAFRPQLEAWLNREALSMIHEGVKILTQSGAFANLTAITVVIALNESSSSSPAPTTIPTWPRLHVLITKANRPQPGTPVAVCLVPAVRRLPEVSADFFFEFLDFPHMGFLSSLPNLCLSSCLHTPLIYLLPADVTLSLPSRFLLSFSLYRRPLPTHYDPSAPRTVIK